MTHYRVDMKTSTKYIIAITIVLIAIAATPALTSPTIVTAYRYNDADVSHTYTFYIIRYTNSYGGIALYAKRYIDTSDTTPFDPSLATSKFSELGFDGKSFLSTGYSNDEVKAMTLQPIRLSDIPGNYSLPNHYDSYLARVYGYKYIYTYTDAYYIPHNETMWKIVASGATVTPSSLGLTVSSTTGGKAAILRRLPFPVQLTMLKRIKIYANISFIKDAAVGIGFLMDNGSPAFYEQYNSTSGALTGIGFNNYTELQQYVGTGKSVFMWMHGNICTPPSCYETIYTNEGNSVLWTYGINNTYTTKTIYMAEGGYGSLYTWYSWNTTPLIGYGGAEVAPINLINPTTLSINVTLKPFGEVVISDLVVKAGFIALYEFPSNTYVAVYVGRLLVYSGILSNALRGGNTYYITFDPDLLPNDITIIIGTSTRRIPYSTGLPRYTTLPRPWPIVVPSDAIISNTTILDMPMFINDRGIDVNTIFPYPYHTYNFNKYSTHNQISFNCSSLYIYANYTSGLETVNKTLYCSDINTTSLSISTPNTIYIDLYNITQLPYPLNSPYPIIGSISYDIYLASGTAYIIYEYPYFNSSNTYTISSFTIFPQINNLLFKRNIIELKPGWNRINISGILMSKFIGTSALHTLVLDVSGTVYVRKFINVTSIARIGSYYIDFVRSNASNIVLENLSATQAQININNILNNSLYANVSIVPIGANMDFSIPVNATVFTVDGDYYIINTRNITIDNGTLFVEITAYNNSDNVYDIGYLYFIPYTGPVFLEFYTDAPPSIISNTAVMVFNSSFIYNVNYTVQPRIIEPSIYIRDLNMTVKLSPVRLKLFFNRVYIPIQNIYYATPLATFNVTIYGGHIYPQPSNTGTFVVSSVRGAVVIANNVSGVDGLVCMNCSIPIVNNYTVVNSTTAIIYGAFRYNITIIDALGHEIEGYVYTPIGAITRSGSILLPATTVTLIPQAVNGFVPRLDRIEVAVENRGSVTIVYKVPTRISIISTTFNRIVGVLRDYYGEPVGGAEVYTIVNGRRISAVTDRNGVFILDVGYPGSYTIHYDGDDTYVSTERVVQNGGIPVDVVLMLSAILLLILLLILVLMNLRRKKHSILASYSKYID